MTYNIDITDKKVLVLSDCHLGITNSFIRENLWVEKLIEISSGFDYVIFNGDMFETWKYGMLGWNKRSRADKIRSILNRLPKLEEFMRKDNVVVIIGNHDYTLVYDDYKMYNPVKFIRCKLGDDIVRIEHGNNADPKYSFDALAKSSMLDSTIAWIEGFVLTWMQKLSIIKNKIIFERKIQDIVFAGGIVDEDIFLEYAKTLNADYVIMGHTHRRILRSSRGITYYNGGSQLLTMQGVSIIDNKVSFYEKEYM